MTSINTHKVRTTITAFAISSFCTFPAFATKIQVVDAKGNNAEGIVVYAQVLPTPPTSVKSPIAMVKQKDKAFVPPLVVAQKGEAVQFMNQDDITHHIYSVGEQNGFSFKIRAGVDDKTQKFNHTGQVSMGCNIHDWMSGYLYVVDTPYFAISDNTGVVELDLPKANSIKLMVWHPNLAKGVAQEFSMPDISAPFVEIKLKGTYTPLEITKPQTDFDFLDDYE